MNYKAQWAPGTKNEEFWREVLVGRTITSLEWDEKGVSALVLDSGERIYTPQNGLPFHVRDHHTENSDVVVVKG